MSRIAALDDVDGRIYEPVQELILALDDDAIPLKLYETCRTPWRQAALFAQGRTIAGKTVTRARAWESLHQFGLAVDMVFWVKGAWTWDEPEPGLWDRYHELARRHGLEPLSFEKPHVQAVGAGLADLQAGRIPMCRWTEQQAELWGSHPRIESGLMHPGAPRLRDIAERPAL